MREGDEVLREMSRSPSVQKERSEQEPPEKGPTPLCRPFPHKTLEVCDHVACFSATAAVYNPQRSACGAMDSTGHASVCIALSSRAASLRQQLLMWLCMAAFHCIMLALKCLVSSKATPCTA